jgi:hypothetical protein
MGTELALSDLEEKLLILDIIKKQPARAAFLFASLQARRIHAVLLPGLRALPVRCRLSL